MKAIMPHQRRALILSRLVIACAAAAAVGGILRAFPTPNPAGAALTQAGAETWSGTYQTNTAAATVELVATLDPSVDATNPAGARVYVGLLDPLPPPGGPTESSQWQDYR